MRLLLAVALAVACLVSDAPGERPVESTAIAISTLPGETLGYDPSSVTVPIGAIVLTFRNRSSLEHNLTFIGQANYETSTIVAPGTDEELRIEGLLPGSYRFVCTIHHEFVGDMSGTLIVEPGRLQ